MLSLRCFPEWVWCCCKLIMDTVWHKQPWRGCEETSNAFSVERDVFLSLASSTRYLAFLLGYTHSVVVAMVSGLQFSFKLLKFYRVQTMYRSFSFFFFKPFSFFSFSVFIHLPFYLDSSQAAVFFFIFFWLLQVGLNRGFLLILTTLYRVFFNHTIQDWYICFLTFTAETAWSWACRRLNVVLPFLLLKLDVYIHVQVEGEEEEEEE